MNELILFFIVIVALLATHYFLHSFKKPSVHYIKITATILLIVLIWFGSSNGKIGMKVILTSVVVTYAIKEAVILIGLKSKK